MLSKSLSNCDPRPKRMGEATATISPSGTPRNMQVHAILQAPDLLSEVLPQAIKLDPALDEAKVTVAMTRLDVIWEQLFPAEQTRIVKILVEKVIVSPNDLEVRLRANSIERLVLEMSPKPIE